jgi:uncharacterized membrane protein
MANLVILGLMKFLHDLFTVLWIGGMLILGIVVLPSLRNTLGKGPEMKNITDAIRRRLSRVALVSIIGLFITGVLISNSSPLFGGYLSFSNTYSMLLAIKHILIGIMVVISLVRNTLLSRMKPETMQKQEKLGMVLLLLNILLGISVLLLSGYSAALSTIEALPQ